MPLKPVRVTPPIDGLAAGAYRYDAERDVLTLIADGDHRDRVAGTTLADHAWLRQAAALLLLSGDLEAAAQHFADQPPVGRRGARYVWLEAGHAGQSIYLQAAEAGLGAVLVAGFDDDRLLGLTPAIVPSGQHPLALLGVGHPADRQS
ncbi:nitroreductase family protein [Streptomyces sp. NBC_01306]|uniref:nitroreductase family protein n=1 Tax=Streptomyces sp. NBC_01306 TaxID=2903819 RepID=UPI00225B906E|nr:nitroreductase family protein [Streptomyces sp. NBC_01306]MCX4728593.1 nitroreductase family protein [Streptomyces sp. NBC_01306]